MSEKKTFTAPEALTIIYRCMMSADGKAEKEEGEALVMLIKKYVDHADQDLGQVLNKSMDFYKSNDMKGNYKFALSAASNLHAFYDHKTLVMIAKDLAAIAMSDGELHEQELLFWTDLLNAMGVSADEV
mgnify:CR=1 FL=1|tara:strand:- start:2904 stop:3290 length:387 start_codon:yes stop_codon:yes gene_type:complete